MNFLTPFQPPTEYEMFDHGFGLSPEHEPEEAVLSFLRNYDNGSALKVTFTMGQLSSLSVSITQNEKVTSELTVDGVKQWAFQSWNGERVMRFYFTIQSTDCDLSVHYEPSPSTHFTAQ